MVKRKADAATLDGPGTSGKDEAPSNVVYVGRVPHGFYEKQMKEYFTQFGRVSKVRLSRNKKTGNSKHYAFLEFQSPEVAKVVADAMDGYHFFGQKLQVRVMRRSEVHPELFKGANRVFKKIPWKKIETERQNKERTPAEEAKRAAAAAKRAEARRKRIKDAGIEYDFPDASTAAKESEPQEEKPRAKGKKSTAQKAALEAAPEAPPAKRARKAAAPKVAEPEVEVLEAKTAPKAVTRARRAPSAAVEKAAAPAEEPAAVQKKAAGGTKKVPAKAAVKTPAAKASAAKAPAAKAPAAKAPAAKPAAKKATEAAPARATRRSART